MYNRYIPQNDGTYRRSRVGEAAAPPPRPMPVRQQAQEEPHPSAPEAPPILQEQSWGYGNTAPRPVPPRPKGPPTGIGTFLKQLIPAGFDTEDLIVVLLLLLMAGDCQEDSNWALLTLFLYLFL